MVAENKQCVVVISHFNQRPLDDLIALIETIDAYPPGIAIEICVVVNADNPITAQIDECLVRSQSYPMSFLYRENIGMNIGAWDCGWRAYEHQDYFLFLQDECRVIRSDWAAAFVEQLDKDQVGIVGESINHKWDFNWNDALAEGADQTLKSRCQSYFEFFANQNINPGINAVHLRSLIWALKRHTLQMLNGFPIGQTCEECVASEIGTSKIIESKQLEVKQVRVQPFYFIAHTEWISTCKVSNLSFFPDFVYGKTFEISQKDYVVKPRTDLFEMVDIMPTSICEIGCADGTNLIHCNHFLGAELGPENLIGVDIAKNISHQAYQNYTFYHQSAEQFVADYIGSQFDLVMLSDVVEHLYNPWDFLIQLKRHLKRKSRVVLSVPNIQNLNYLNAVTTGNFRYQKTGLFDATHIRFFSVETIKEALETSGFRVVKQSFRPDYSLQSLRDKIETSLKDETDFFLNIDSVKLKLNKLNLDRYFSQQVLVSAVPL